MPHAHSYDAIVLRTIDVGEADRFCILFTRERGRLAVRAPGVRRLRSRMGGALLPLCRALISVKELSSGGHVVAASPLSSGIPLGDPLTFFRAEGGMEILLALLHDEHPFPDLFDAAIDFLARCSNGDHVLLTFTFRTLHFLGFLPESDGCPQTLSTQEWAFIDASCSFPFVPISVPVFLGNLRRHCVNLLQDQLSRPLVAQTLLHDRGGLGNFSYEGEG